MVPEYGSAVGDLDAEHHESQRESGPEVNQDNDGEAETIYDPTTLVRHRQNQFLQLSKFELAMGLFAHIFGINRTQYAGPREVLGLITANGQQIIQALPNQLSALKGKVSKRFPMNDMCTAEIPLRVEKIATEKASRKWSKAKSPRPPSICSTPSIYSRRS